MRKKSKSSTLPKELFYEHFKHLVSDNDAFTNDFVKTHVNDNVFMNNNNVEFLDRRISIEEINISISSLKNGKSGSVDSLIPQLFKVCHNQLDLCYVNCLISYLIIIYIQKYGRNE